MCDELNIPPPKIDNDSECFMTDLIKEEIQMNWSDHNEKEEEMHISAEECCEVNGKLETIDDQHMKPLKGKFLQTDEVIDLLSNETMHLKTIPKSAKNNTYFLIDNSENLKRKSNGKTMEFWDNCGAWESKSASTKTAHFVKRNGKLMSVVKKGEAFCKEVKKQFVPIEPQPNETELVIMKRYYATLKRDKTYKKRITWFESLPGYPAELLSLAVAEYLGKFPIDEISRHGNARKTKQEYIRISPTTKQTLLDDVKSKKSVEDIFKEHFDTEHQPRDTKLIHNMKFKVNKESNPGNRQNNANDIQNIINMSVDQNSFIKEIVQLAGKPPNIICYSDNQLKLFKKCIKKSVVGIDRTFNLGACYVTSIVFQDHDVLHKGKETPPILLGPFFLHWDGAFQTYQRFFTHLASVLEDVPLETELSSNNLIIGSDEEKALVKAVKMSLPQSKLTLCTRRLEENLKRQLKNKVGMAEQKTEEICKAIFGPDGLTNLNTSIAFQEKATEIERKFNVITNSYLSDILIPAIKEFVHDVHKNDERVPIKWKNNHCEAMNHVFKLNIKWKPAKLPDLVKMLEKEVALQESLLRRALLGHGDYELSASALSLRVPIAVWHQKTESEKQLLFKKFLSFANKKKPTVTTLASSDGKLLIPKTSTVAKKPGQKRRIVDSKTSSLPKRKKTE